MTDYTPEAIEAAVAYLRGGMENDDYLRFDEALKLVCDLAERVAKAEVTMPRWQNVPERTWVEATVPDGWFNQRVYLVNLEQSP
jgi:hypothetical protein